MSSQCGILLCRENQAHTPHCSRTRLSGVGQTTPSPLETLFNRLDRNGDGFAQTGELMNRVQIIAGLVLSTTSLTTEHIIGVMVCRSERFDEVLPKISTERIVTSWPITGDGPGDRTTVKLVDMLDWTELLPAFEQSYILARWSVAGRVNLRVELLNLSSTRASVGPTRRERNSRQSLIAAATPNSRSSPSIGYAGRGLEASASWQCARNWKNVAFRNLLISPDFHRGTHLGCITRFRDSWASSRLLRAVARGVSARFLTATITESRG